MWRRWAVESKLTEEEKKDRRREQFKRYRENNKEKIKIAQKKWCEENKEKRKEYRIKNKAKIAKRAEFYYEKNKEKIKEKHKEYYEGNKDKFKENGIKWRKNNKEKMIDYYKSYEEDNKYEIKERKKEYYKNNKYEIDKKHEKYNSTTEAVKKRRERDNKRRECFMFRLNGNMSSGIRSALRGGGLSKKGRHWENLVGYTVHDLKERLEKLFQTGMTWENYGDWHVDHIIAKSLFKIKEVGDEEFMKCWSLDNLQPLWAVDNIKKSNHLNGEKK